MAQILSRRYALAFLKYSQEIKKEDSVLKEFEILTDLLNNSKELCDFLNNPSISSFERDNILSSFFSDRADGVILKFLLFLESKGRLYLIRDIIKSFRELYNQLKGVLIVNIETTSKMDSGQIDEIVNRLKQKFHKEVSVNLKIDPRLVAGIKIEIDGEVLDYSFATQLRNFRQSILASSN